MVLTLLRMMSTGLLNERNSPKYLLENQIRTHSAAFNSFVMDSPVPKR